MSDMRKRLRCECSVNNLTKNKKGSFGLSPKIDKFLALFNWPETKIRNLSGIIAWHKGSSSTVSREIRCDGTKS